MPAGQCRYSNEEIARIGDGIYRQVIRPKVMPQQKGRFLVLEIETGDYEVDENDLHGEERLRARHPDGILYVLRIGYVAAYTLCGRMVEESQTE